MRSELGSITHVTTSRADSGQVRQMVSAITSAADSTTATINWTDTIPQATEGKLFLGATITPAATANTLIVHGTAVFAINADTRAIFSLFAGPTGGATGDAKASVVFDTTINDPYCLAFTWAGNPTAATTHVYSLRGGPSAGNTLTLNGASGGRYLGGVSLTSLVIMEVVA